MPKKMMSMTASYLSRASARGMSTLVRSKIHSFKAPAVFPDGSIKTLSIDDYKGQWVVLFYYPLDWTFVCPTEIVDFSDHSDKFKASNCAVIGASIDSANSHHAWMNTPRNKGGLGAMKIPLLADVSKDVARGLGFLVENGSDDLNGIALRGTVIVDPSGTIRHLSINDAPVGRSVEETLRLVHAFQYTDKHGEVCPSGWKPGQKSMKADPKGSQEYFSQLK